MRRRQVLIWTGIAVTVASAYLAVRNAHLADVRHALETSDYRWLLPAFVSLAVAVVLRAVRWRALFAPATRPPLVAVTRALLIGYLFNNVFPARAGEPARIVALKREAGTSRAEATATVVTERVYDVVVLLLLLFVAAPWLPAVSWLRAAAVFALVVAAAVTTAVGVLARYDERPLRGILRPLARFPVVTGEHVDRTAANLAQGLAGFRHGGLAAVALLWTIASWLALALSCWLLSLGFQFDVPPQAGVLIVVAVNLAMILPSSPAAVGVFEAATQLALDAYDVPPSPALSFALVLHALNFLPYIVAGLVVIAVPGRRKTRVVPTPER